jgi:hypothetical protein
MQMLYNSAQFAVVRFDVPATSSPSTEAGEASLTRGGYEIVDKFARKEIFLEGAVAEHFKSGVQALIDAEAGASEELLDDFIAGYTALAQHPVVLH